MSLEAYNIVFKEPPKNTNHKISLSSQYHYGLISLFKPVETSITEMFVLISHRSGTGDKSNNLKLSIINIDDEDDYLPSSHTAALAAVGLASESEKVKTYMDKLHETALGTATLYTPSNNSDSPGFLSNQNARWVRFKFEGGVVLDTDTYYGFLLTDAQNSSLVTEIYYADNVYEATSLNRTYFSSAQTGLTWNAFLEGDRNVQICVAYPTTQITGGVTLDHGTVTTAGGGSNRNSGLGLYVKNSSNTENNYFVNSFSVGPDGNGDPGPLTHQAGEPWRFFEGVLPPTQLSINSEAAILETNFTGVDLQPNDFIFFFQRDWGTPIPKTYLYEYLLKSKQVDGSTDTSSENSPFIPYDKNNVFLSEENTNAFYSDYPGLSQINDSLSKIQTLQIYEPSDSNTVYNFNAWKAVRYDPSGGQIEFVENILDLSIIQSEFSTGDYYLNTTSDRDSTSDMHSNWGLSVRKVESDKDKLILDNYIIFPENGTDVSSNSIDALSISIIGNDHEDSTGSQDFTVTISEVNNTVLASGFNKNKIAVGDLNNKFFYRVDPDTDGIDYNSPPHLILSNQSTSGADSYRIILGGVCLYTGAFSSDRSSNKIDMGIGVLDTSRTLIFDSNLAKNTPPVNYGVEYSGGLPCWGRGLCLTVHPGQSEIDGSTYEASVDGYYPDRKYLIRSIYNNIITIEGKVLLYGMGSFSVASSGTGALTYTVTNKTLNSADIAALENTDCYLVINPFGFQFGLSGGVYTPDDVVNLNDPIPLLHIKSGGIVTDSNGISTITVDGNIQDYLANWVFYTASGSMQSPIVGNATTEAFPDLPFYIIQIPDTNAASGTKGVDWEWTGPANADGVGFTSEWIGFSPDFFNFSNAKFYQVGCFSDLEFAGPGYGYGSWYDELTSQALLPTCPAGEGYTYSITIPYFTNVNNWPSYMSSLFDSNTSIDADSIKILDTAGSETKFAILDNPIAKMLPTANTTETVDASARFKYEVIEAYSSAENPENIWLGLSSTRFTSVGDAAQIHIDNTSGATGFRRLSFMYKLDDTTTQTDVYARFKLLASKDNFITSDINTKSDLIAEIEISTGSTSSIDFTGESVYSLNFDNTLEYTDFILKKTAGEGIFLVNNFNLFNDYAVYGACNNPTNAFVAATTDPATTYCEILSPNGSNPGYLIIDLANPTYVNNITFEVYDSSGNNIPNESALFVHVYGFDENVHDEFFRITPSEGQSSSDDGTDSTVEVAVGRTVRQLLIRAVDGLRPFRLNNLSVQLRNNQIPVIEPASSTGSLSYLPTSDIVDTDESMVLNPQRALSPYAGRSVRFQKNGDTIYIPVGYWNTPVTFGTAGAATLIDQNTPFTRVSFNLDADTAPTSTYTFEIFYATTVTGGDVEGQPNEDEWTSLGTFDAKLYQREPESGFYTISSIEGDTIILSDEDAFFGNNGARGHFARLNKLHDYYGLIKTSDNTSGSSRIKLEGFLNQLNVQAGNELYVEKSNVFSFPAVNAKWIKIKLVDTGSPVNMFGLKLYTSALDDNGDPIDVISDPTLTWNIKIGYED